MTADLNKYPNDDSDFDPRNWEDVVERQFVTLTNERTFYDKVVKLVRRLITEPTIQNHRDIRLCVYITLEKLEPQFAWGKTFDKYEEARGIMMAALTEDIIEYYCEMHGCKPPRVESYADKDNALREYVAVINAVKKPKMPILRTTELPFREGDFVRVLPSCGDTGKFDVGDVLIVVDVRIDGDVQVAREDGVALDGGWWYTKYRFELIEPNQLHDPTQLLADRDYPHIWRHPDAVNVGIINQSINEHLSQIKSTKGENSMSIFNQIKAAKANVDALTDSITDDQIFEEIVRLEAEVEKYSKTKAQPKAIKAKIDGLKAEIKALVDFSDSREAK